MSGRVESLDREVSGKSPAQQVGEEAGEDVEKDEGREEGTDGEDSVRLGDVDLVLETVEGCCKIFTGQLRVHYRLQMAPRLTRVLGELQIENSERKSGKEGQRFSSACSSVQRKSKGLTSFCKRVRDHENQRAILPDRTR